MAVDQEQPIEIAIDSQLGIYNAVQPTSLPKGGYLLKKNAYMNKVGSNAKRFGSAPVTTNALAATIPNITVYQFPNSVATGAAPTLSAVGNAASTLPAGTYYVRRTCVTDYGETEASAEVSVVVPPPVANPSTAPTLATATTGGLLPAATYYVVYTWVNAVGETLVSAEANIITTGTTSTITVTIPALPSGATSANIYISTATGTETKQGSTVTTTYTQTAALVAGAVIPVANTCIASNLRIVSPAIPFHANSINLYISTSSNTETKQINTTSLTYNQNVPLVAGVAYPATNTTAFSAELLASSGTSLYSFYNADFHAATMTNSLASSNIYTVGFTNKDLSSILFITDGSSMKKYDGSAVTTITPAADDASPLPPNAMSAINLLNPIYCWIYAGYLMVSNGKDVAYYSKKYFYDYFPNTFFARWVRNNDYMTGPGMPYGNVCMVPFRRGWGVLTGTDDTNFAGNVFLNTVNGNIAPRAIAKITYPDGSQTVGYLSDDGPYEIYDTGFIDSSGTGSRNYATRPLMKDKVDFSSYGFTEAEKIAANAYFDSITNMYILCIKRSTTNYAFAYDVRNREWTGLWENVRAESTIRFNNVLYYAGATKLLHKYDDTLATDYDDLARTTGTIVDWDCYTDLLHFEDTGYQSYLDYIVFFVKNFSTPSSMDFTVITFTSTEEYLNAVRSQYMTWGITNWGEAVWANLDFSTQVGAPTRRVVKKRSFYFQIRMRNAKNELFELYKYKLIGRTSGN